MSTLFEIVKNHKSLDELMLEQDGEITDQQQEQIVDLWMSEITSDLSLKADGYKYRIDNIDSSAEALRDRARQISSAAKTLENMSDLLKERMKQAMIELGITHIDGKAFKFKLSDGKPTVKINHQDLLPSKYLVETISLNVDKDKVLEDLKNNIEVEGAELKTSKVLRVTVNKNLKELK